jgi:membrane-anchored glycerophosphoryl diester phosphodiesterase (GDPDase)
MRDILSFNSFITQDVLIFFYYVGALVIPVVLYYFRDYLIKKLRVKDFYISLSVTEQKVFWVSFITLFICAELCWRMIFEAMIGYFDMHDYLYEISKKLS